MNLQPANTVIESLTKRELDVLSLLAEGLSNQEIAQSLVMEVGTVKWFNTQIYGKLQVKNRQQAVSRARTLGILEALPNDPLQGLQHNLPANTLPFIGREREIRELRQQLSSEKYRLISILGPGGMGKTRLSIEVGRQLLGYFMDGVYFVPLAVVTSAEQIVTTIAEIVGFKFHSDRQPEHQLLDHLQRQRVLLIMDNFEHLLDSAGLLTHILEAAPSVKILTTSRERLGLGGEVVYVIGGLAIPFDHGQEIGAHDAVKLFVEVAHRTPSPVSDNDLGVVAAICQMLGGMPLAILLATAWLDTLSLAEIAAEIQSGLDILAATLRDAPPRHQSIEAVFDYSFKRLAPQEQAVFMRLSVFRSGFSREAAQRVSTASLGDLQQLVQKSFLQHLPSGRYAIHELMRQYGERRLAESGELTRIREEHARYFADLYRPVGEAGWMGTDAQTMQTVTPDFENVRAAWHFHLERKDAFSLGRILDGIWVFLDAVSRSQEALDLFEPALAAFRGDESGEVRLLCGKLTGLLGWFCGDIGQKARALELTEQALAMLRPLGPSEPLLLALAGHSIFLAMANEMQQATEEIELGLELARTMGDVRWEGTFCYMMGSACLAIGDYQGALDWAELMPRQFKWGIKGNALSGIGDYVHAEECLTQALGQNPYHRYAMASTHRALMGNSLLGGDHEQAWRYLQHGLRYVDDAAYAWVALEHLQAAVELFISEHQYPTAVQMLSLIIHHPDTMAHTRANTARYEDMLKASLLADEFAAAWARGQQLDLGDLITELMER